MKPAGGRQQESVRELIARLIDETKAYARAEVTVIKATVRAWIAPAKIAVPLVIIAILLLQAALTVLVGALGFALATWLGTAGGLAVAALIVLLIAGLLVGIAIAQFSGAGK